MMKLDEIHRIIYGFNHCNDTPCSKCEAGKNDYCYLLSVFLDQVTDAFASCIKKELFSQEEETKRSEKRKDPV